MRIGVISDVHGNLEAFKACIKHLKNCGAACFIQCGDLIGYGPEAEACVGYARQLPLLASVMGNHDAVLAYPAIRNLFNFDANAALDESLPHLSKDNAHYLVSLPAVARGENFTVLHGTPLDPVKEYFHNSDQFQDYYEMWQGQILFVGHTHLPFYMEGSATSCDMDVSKQDEFVLPLQDKYRYVINPGAVGKPRDHNPHASCGLWDTCSKTFTFYRVRYDVAVTQEKMRRQHFPEILIESLGLGL